VRKAIADGISIALLCASILLTMYWSTLATIWSLHAAVVCTLASVAAVVIWHRGDGWSIGDWVFASIGGAVATFTLLAFDCNGRFPSDTVWNSCAGLHDGSILFTLGAVGYFAIALVGICRGFLLKAER
jgi:hypothetical protein